MLVSEGRSRDLAKSWCREKEQTECLEIMHRICWLPAQRWPKSCVCSYCGTSIWIPVLHIVLCPNWHSDQALHPGTLIYNNPSFPSSPIGNHPLLTLLPTRPPSYLLTPSHHPHPLPHVHSQWSLHVCVLAPFSSLSPLPCLMFWQVLWVLTILPVPKLLSRLWMASRLAWRGWRCSWRGQRMLIVPTEELWEPLDTKH